MAFFSKNMTAGVAQGYVITSNYHLQPWQTQNQFVMTISLAPMLDRLSADQSLNYVCFSAKQINTSD